MTCYFRHWLVLVDIVDREAAVLLLLQDRQSLRLAPAVQRPFLANQHLHASALHYQPVVL